MIKILFSFCLAVFLFSCKKDRTCECTYESGSKSTITILKKSKKKAKAECDFYSQTISGVTLACELK